MSLEQRKALGVWTSPHSSPSRYLQIRPGGLTSTTLASALPITPHPTQPPMDPLGSG